MNMLISQYIKTKCFIRSWPRILLIICCVRISMLPPLLLDPILKDSLGSHIRIVSDLSHVYILLRQVASKSSLVHSISDVMLLSTRVSADEMHETFSKDWIFVPLPPKKRLFIERY